MNSLLSGVSALNGFKFFKCTSAEETLKVFDEHLAEVDSMPLDGKITADRGAMIISKVKLKKPNVKIIVVANNGSVKTRVHLILLRHCFYSNTRYRIEILLLCHYHKISHSQYVI